MDVIRRIDGQRGFISILLQLLKGEKANVKEITVYSKISNTAAYNAIPILKDLDLIIGKEEFGEYSRGRKRKNYYLTDRGERVAKKLVEMIEEIKEGKIEQNR